MCVNPKNTSRLQNTAYFWTEEKTKAGDEIELKYTLDTYILSKMCIREWKTGKLRLKPRPTAAAARNCMLYSQNIIEHAKIQYIIKNNSSKYNTSVCTMQL